MPPVRRLTAILAADVAGYSRLMGADEEGTHERLKAHLQELIEPKIAGHRGRIVKNAGDGFLAEFASVVDAVRCAVEIQQGMADRNAGTPPEAPIEFRVGINLGDVIAEGEDIFGDGVNVAARLEALAEPGGICISRVVRDQVRDRVDYTFEDLGEQSVKNIARPVRVFALRPETSVAMASPDLVPIREVPISARRRRSIALQSRRRLQQCSSSPWLLGGSGSLQGQLPRPQGSARQPPSLRSECPWSPHAYRLSCSPSPISATIPTNNILPTASPRI